MGHENVETVQKIYAAFKRRDMAFVFSQLADNFTVVQSTGVPWGGTYHGREGFEIFMGKLFANVTGVLEGQKFIKSDDSVAVIGRTTGMLLGSGGTFDLPYVHLWHFREKLAERFEIYVDEEQMMSSTPN